MRAWVAAAAIGVTVLLIGTQCRNLRRVAIDAMEPEYVPPAGDLEPVFDGADADRERFGIRMERVADGLGQITDLQFEPGRDDRLVVLDKGGTAHHVDLAIGERSVLFEVDVLDWSEQGLLGVAFHPRFPEDPRLFVNYTPAGPGRDLSRVSAWTVSGGRATETAVLLEVPQPYQNHNAGQLVFGPDGMLYVGWGDGGYRADPEGNGQDASTLLGAMLRIDVDGDPYAIPPDNPWVDDPDVPDEVWAIGLRNPWRYSFDPSGRLIIADVGQDRWEEVSIATAGANLGWNVREGRHCFPENAECSSEGLVDPVYEYGRDEGISITGGYVYTGDAIPALQGRYLFGDFVSGRIWALELPDTPGAPAPDPVALGKWPLLISTFGRDASGEVYVADYGGGAVYRISPPPP